VTNLETGAATAGGTLAGAAMGAAYTDSVLGAGAATLYVIDTGTDRLRIANPSTGALTDVGALGTDLMQLGGLDIDGRNNLGFVASTEGSSSHLYTLDVRSGALSASLGIIGTSSPLIGVTRATPEVFFSGVTVDGKLIRFNINNPSMITVVTDPSRMIPTDLITGLGANEYLVSVDFSPGPNLYGLTNLGNLYSVNSSIADTTMLGALHADAADTSAPFSMLSGAAFDLDFDLTGAASLRIVSDTGQNLRLSAMLPPSVITDPTLSSSSAIDIVGAAYTNNYIGATSTTLYAIDGTANRLLLESPRNSGQLIPVGPLGVTGKLVGFDIGGGNNGLVIAGMQRAGESFTRVYKIDLATGAATQIGDGIGGAALRSMAIYIR
jgi:hypothetical protein